MNKNDHLKIFVVLLIATILVSFYVFGADFLSIQPSGTSSAGFLGKYVYVDGSTKEYKTTSFENAFPFLPLEIFSGDKELSEVQVYILLRSNKDITGSFSCTIETDAERTIINTQSITKSISLISGENYVVSVPIFSYSATDITDLASTVPSTILITVRYINSVLISNQEEQVQFVSEQLTLSFTISEEGVIPQPTPTPTPAASPTPTPYNPSATPTPVPTPTPTPTPTPPPSGTIFESGFESGTLSDWSSQYVQSGASLTVQSSNVYQGSYSLQATCTVGLGAYVENSLTSSYPTLHTRGYFMFSALPSAYSAIKFMDIKDTLNNEIAIVSFMPTGTNTGKVYVIYPETWTGAGGSSTFSLSANTYHSWEIQVTRGATNGIIRVWVDDILYFESTSSDTDRGADYNKIVVGNLWSEVDSSIYIDNVKASTTKIGTG